MPKHDVIKQADNLFQQLFRLQSENQFAFLAMIHIEPLQDKHPLDFFGNISFRQNGVQNREPSRIGVFFILHQQGCSLCNRTDKLPQRCRNINAVCCYRTG